MFKIIGNSGNEYPAQPQSLQGVHQGDETKPASAVVIHTLMSTEESQQLRKRALARTDSRIFKQIDASQGQSFVGHCEMFGVAEIFQQGTSQKQLLREACLVSPEVHQLIGNPSSSLEDSSSTSEERGCSSLKESILQKKLPGNIEELIQTKEEQWAEKVNQQLNLLINQLSWPLDGSYDLKRAFDRVVKHEYSELFEFLCAAGIGCPVILNALRYEDTSGHLIIEQGDIDMVKALTPILVDPQINEFIDPHDVNEMLSSSYAVAMKDGNEELAEKFLNAACPYDLNWNIVGKKLENEASKKDVEVHRVVTRPISTKQICIKTEELTVAVNNEKSVKTLLKGVKKRLILATQEGDNDTINRLNGYIKTAFLGAVCNRNIRNMQVFLLDANAEKNDIRKELLEAVQKGDIKIAKCLQAFAEDDDIVDAIEEATKLGKVEIVNMLISERWDSD